MSKPTASKPRPTTRKVAIIQAATVEVLCPHCGEPQHSPDTGSHMWMPSQVSEKQGMRTCVSCDEDFRLNAQSHVVVCAPEEPLKKVSPE